MKAISLFSGMGGDTLGMRNAGVDVIGFSEINKDAISSHLSNFPESKLIGNGDITKTTEEELKEFSEVDIIFAGFPCQGFSNAGKKLPDDPRNTLFREFLRVTSIIKPKIIIGENVKGLLSRENVDNKPYINIIVKEFEKLGYNVKYGLVKCEEHGVPQKRTRLFIIGSLSDNGIKTEEIKSNPYISMDKDPTVGLREFIEPSLKDSVEIDLSFMPKYKIVDTLDDISGSCHPYISLKQSHSQTHYWNGKDYEYNGKTYDKLFSFAKRDSPIHVEVVDVDAPCKTIICTYGHQPRMLVPLRKNNKTYLRAFNINELKQCQAFSRDFIVTGSTSSQIKQIGNAVPPKFCTKLVNYIVKNIS